MLKLRMQRIGRKNEPHFRAVVTDRKNATKSGKFIEIVGSYNPKSGVVQFNKDRVEYWLGKGVQPSDTMHNFLIDQGFIKGKKINVLPKKRPIQKEGEAAVAQPPKSEPQAEAPKPETPKEEAPASA